jgi:DNA invertase Pin-like site-specific DNA recombinase
MNVAERERQTELFDQRCAEATAAGIWQRRQTPLGYIKDPLSRRLVPSDNADKVRRAFSDRLAGKSIVAIARDLQMTPGRGASRAAKSCVSRGAARTNLRQHKRPSGDRRRRPLGVDPAGVVTQAAGIDWSS